MFAQCMYQKGSSMASGSIKISTKTTKIMRHKNDAKQEGDPVRRQQGTLQQQDVYSIATKI